MNAVVFGIIVAAAVAGGNALGSAQHPFALQSVSAESLDEKHSVVTVVKDRVSKNRVLGTSADRILTSGVYSAQAGNGSIDSYPLDEVMYFVSGDMSLTSLDGDVIDLKAGDAVHVPQGWQGSWETHGYTKFYVVYDKSVKR